jgi:hypothetical protein
MNWTISFRSDSEVNDCAYGCTYSRIRDEFKQKIDTKLKQEFQILKQKMKTEFDLRTNKAVWFVSNCLASFRIQFGLKLEKHFPFDIYGQCRDYFLFQKLNPTKNNYYYYLIFNFISNLFISKSNNEECKRGSKCELIALNENKFYLSFESKNCSNYITEKLWRVLSSYSIPIVIQPAKHYYEQILPENSFIHAQDFNFDTIKLANYLKSVSNNFTLYLKHHLWRLDYSTVYSGEQCEKRRICELCTRLNDEQNTIYYKKISNWFNNACF